jgi:hypothetical protein
MISFSTQLTLYEPGLPDGIFSYQTPQFWYILKGLFGNFCGHLLYFKTIYDKLYFSIYIFLIFGLLYHKTLATLERTATSQTAYSTRLHAF